ncbi:MAG: hypothetical protein RL362_1088, partial [Bacteroidota bacterium]
MKKDSKIGIGVMFIVLFFAFQGKAQDPEFTQFYTSPMYLNPA